MDRIQMWCLTMYQITNRTAKYYWKIDFLQSIWWFNPLKKNDINTKHFSCVNLFKVILINKMMESISLLHLGAFFRIHFLESTNRKCRRMLKFFIRIALISRAFKKRHNLTFHFASFKRGSCELAKLKKIQRIMHEWNI